jgi:hypothetical protein
MNVWATSTVTAKQIYINSVDAILNYPYLRVPKAFLVN